LTFGFIKCWEFLELAEQLSAPQEGLCFMDLDVNIKAYELCKVTKNVFGKYEVCMKLIRSCDGLIPVQGFIPPVLIRI
jgi:hypothetical protein